MSERVVLLLDEDWRSDGNNDKLQARFLLQSKGMKKYLERVDEFFADSTKKLLIEFYDDRQVLMRAIREGRTPIFTEFLSDSLKKDREFVLNAAKVGPVVDWASSEFLKDFEIVLEMVKFDSNVVDHLPSSIIKDREKVKMLVQANDSILDSLCMYDRDREIGMLSVKSGGEIPLAFLNDKEFLKEHIIRNPRNVREIDPKDKNLAIEIVKAHPHVLPNLPINLQRDRDVFYEAVKLNGALLGQTNIEKFKKDREIVLAACKAGYSIDPQTVSLFYNDRELLINCLKSNPYSINCLSAELKKDKELLKTSLTSLKSSVLPFAKLPDNLGNDREFMKELIILNPATYELLSEELKSDRELAILALERNGELLEFVHEDLRADKDIVKIAITNCGSAIQFAHTNIINDMNFAMDSIRQTGAAIIHLPQLHSDRKAFLEALGNFHTEDHFDLFQYASAELKDDRDFVKQVIKTNPKSYRNISERLKDDNSLVMELVDEMPSILKYQFYNHRFDREFLFNIIKRDASVFTMLPYQFHSDFDFILEAVSQNGLLMDRAPVELFHLLKKSRMDREYPQLFISSTPHF